MAATYDGASFDTALLARWAAFFDLAGWKWTRCPAAIQNWRPDFRVTFPCDHSECNGHHTILVSVLDVKEIDSVKGHPALSRLYNLSNDQGEKVADAGALFGAGPAVSQWQMSHGAGGGLFTVTEWENNASQMWAQAEKTVR